MSPFLLKFVKDCSECEETRDIFFFSGAENSCSKCVDRSKVFKSKLAFYNRIWELGGRILGEYQGANISVKCECVEGHKCSPRPSDIKRGHGMCLVCAGRDPIEAGKNFHKAILSMGGTVVGKYIRKEVPVECKCQKGHKCSPCPNNIQQGHGMCKICAGNDSEEAEKNFRASIADLGGKVLGEYQGANFPVKCECLNGHICSPHPANIQQGQGMCSSCGLKSEPLCREIFEDLLKCQMPKVRPSWLLWKKGRSLELDGYNEEMQIAFEYQGVQHDHYVPHFHPNGPEDLDDQQERDKFKVKICLERGVRLIHIPSIYTYRDPETMRNFISSILSYSG